MDHIPEVVNSKYPLMEVPYLYDEKYPYLYDNHVDGWADYPARMGWDKHDFVAKADFTQGGTKSPEESASFLQAWLFFGAIATFFEIIAVDSTTYLKKKSDGTFVVSTATLVDDLRNWNNKLESMTVTEQEMVMRQCNDLMRELTGFITKYLLDTPHAPYVSNILGQDIQKSPLLPSIALSISLLAVEFEHARQIADWKIPRGNETFFTLTSDFLDSRFADGYWCPSDPQYLKVINLPCRYFISMLGLNHTDLDHSSCTTLTCLAMDIDENNYETKHDDTCTCNGVEFPAIDLELTESILFDGKIPLVSVYSGSDKTPKIRVTEAQSSTPYIALSHIWADGLGNPTGNSLPQCQLVRLQRLVNQVAEVGPEDPPIPFWIDTLCVPISPGGQARKLAIARLSETYKNAVAVLVLDAGIFKLPSTISGYELFARIFMSNWLRRLWTLQEGVFAKRLYFQFSDKAIDMDAEYLLAFYSLDIKIPSFFQSLCGWYSDLRGHLRNPEPYDRRFLDVIHRTRHRSTSHAEDEIICVASLLGYTREQMKELFEVPVEERRMKFLDMQSNFPRHILFGSGEKMVEEGYGWCPKSFLTHSPVSEAKEEETTLIKTAFGVTGKFLNFIILAEGRTVNGMFSFKDETNGAWYMVSKAKDSGFPDSECWVHDFEYPAIILDKLQLVGGEQSRGALVELIDREEDDTAVARYICKVIAALLPGEHGEVGVQPYDTQEGDLVECRAVTFGVQSHWRIV